MDSVSVTASNCDPDLLLALQRRDASCVDAVVTQLNPYLVRLLRAQSIHGFAAEEIVHDTWERFFTNLERFEGRSSLRTFVTGILINKTREARRASTRYAFTDDSERMFDEAFTPEGWWKRDPPNPGALLEICETGEGILECLDGLSEKQRLAFVMIEMDDGDPADICNVLEVSSSNLRVLLFRAKEKLRVCLTARL